MTYFPLYQTTCFFIPFVAPCKPLLLCHDYNTFFCRCKLQESFSEFFINCPARFLYFLTSTLLLRRKTPGKSPRVTPAGTDWPHIFRCSQSFHHTFSQALIRQPRPSARRSGLPLILLKLLFKFLVVDHVAAAHADEQIWGVVRRADGLMWHDLAGRNDAARALLCLSIWGRFLAPVCHSMDLSACAISTARIFRRRTKLTNRPNTSVSATEIT